MYLQEGKLTHYPPFLAIWAIRPQSVTLAIQNVYRLLQVRIFISTLPEKCLWAIFILGQLSRDTHVTSSLEGELHKAIKLMPTVPKIPIKDQTLSFRFQDVQWVESTYDYNFGMNRCGHEWLHTKVMSRGKTENFDG